MKDPRDWKAEMNARQAADTATRNAEAVNHRPLCDANGAPIVTFSPNGVSTKDLEFYPHMIISQSADLKADVQVGLLYLSQAGLTTLRLDQISVYDYFGKRGFGSAAVQHLVALARSSGYQKIVGELLPDNPRQLPDLIRFYERIGFAGSHTKSGTEVSINL